ncbi:hypothetical protein BASA50_003784 [Batrachochytrium salamandrivorans]|uniref:Uncharacterized protein n=1 Tax=Batrachochytrium salamandrivorans TaxID=1357716 RepID=A0ABQ8FHF1_9FUNG|nr:hypothetical protein BASA50_003784 [Batrachochytrium salamandrivorans]
MVWASTIQGPLWRYSPIFPINGSLVVAVSYGVYYIALCPSIGALYLPLLLMMYRGSEIFATQAGWPIPPVIAATILHIISWVFQILGHALFEGRAPAFMKEPIQAFVLAPLFVFCEVLFDLGFFKKTHARLEIKVEAAVKKLDATSKSQ